MSQKRIVGCIYKHPNVSVCEFTNDFLEPLLEKLSFKQKEVILMGDFNINLLNCNIDKSIHQIMWTLYAPMLFFPTINSPMRITANSKTLIDKIFYNDVTKIIISGNTTSISDHLTQFLLISNQNPSSKNQMLKTNDKRSFRNINSMAFEEDLKKINWNEALTLSEENPNMSFKTFLDIVEVN